MDACAAPERPQLRTLVARQTSDPAHHLPIKEIPVMDLLVAIRDGRLPVGTQLNHRLSRSSGETVTAVVVEDGLRIGKRTFQTPSGAARSITGKPVDGWKFWRLPNGSRLDSLRAGERRLD